MRTVHPRGRRRRLKVNLVAVQAKTELMAEETDAEEIVVATVEVDGRG